MRRLVIVILCGCGSSPGAQLDASGPDPTGDALASTIDAAPGQLALPPAGGKFDYQLGGAYAAPSGVVIVSRDRTAAPAAGHYNICYVNGFQIQPDETPMWMSQHPELILRDAQNQPVIDTAWNEILIDTSTPAKRTGVAAVVGGWIDGCKQAGFDAVEIDNLDSYSRSKGLLTEDNNVATLALFAAAAHADGLAIAQKNASELVGRRAELGTDFVTAEECNRYTECAAYFAGYDRVLMIEYRTQDFTAGCTAYPAKSLVLRDVDLVVPGDPAYVFQLCP